MTSLFFKKRQFSVKQNWLKFGYIPFIHFFVALFLETHLLQVWSNYFCFYMPFYISLLDWRILCFLYVELHSLNSQILKSHYTIFFAVLIHSFYLSKNEWYQWHFNVGFQYFHLWVWPFGIVPLFTGVFFLCDAIYSRKAVCILIQSCVFVLSRSGITLWRSASHCALQGRIILTLMR